MVSEVDYPFCFGMPLSLAYNDLDSVQDVVLLLLLLIILEIYTVLLVVCAISTEVLHTPNYACVQANL